MDDYKVYILICPIDHIVRYVGITSTTLARRLREHLKAKKANNAHKFHYIQKLKSLGLKPIIQLVVENLTQQRACELEVELIAKYRTELGEKLLNISPGGFTPSEETKRKISEANSGSNHYNYGKSLRPEHRKAVSASLKGRVFTDEHRRKQSNALIGRTMTDEWRKKNSEAQKASEKARANILLQSAKLRKAVIQSTLDGIEVARYVSMREASRQTGINFALIQQAVNGKLKTAGGYHWKLYNLPK